MAHTKGPWVVNKKKNHPWVVECTTNIPGVMGEVAIVNYKPNARLIALAPELLEALKRFVESSPCQNNCKKGDMTCDTQYAKYVIARAEGKE